MKFGFIAHPTSMGLKRHVKILDLLDRTLKEQEDGYDHDLWTRRNLIPFMDFGRIESADGAVCDGLLTYMPLTAEEMLRQPRAIAERVVEGVNLLKSRGAELVGLGGFTGIVGNRGLTTLDRAAVPVTTGNSLTAYAAYHNLLDTLAHLEIDPSAEEIAIVGFPGSIALVVAKLLAARGARLALVYRGDAQKGAALRDYMPEAVHDRLRMTNDITSCYERCHFYVAATSSGGVIDPYRLLPGSVVIDAALPRDVMPYREDRDDILIIDGGLVSAGPGFKLGGEMLGLAPKKMMNGCFAETMVLALENRPEAFSIGRELDTDKVLEIGRIAARHGITPQRMASYGEKLDPADFHALRRFHHPSPLSGLATLDTLSSDALKTEVMQRFGDHINPILRDFYRFNHIDRVFTSAQGCELREHDGRTFLDFVAAYGSLNVGHNHPKVVGALRTYLDGAYPTFAQYVSAPLQASLLAEKLCEVAPGALQRVFFSNSGAEAVEAAIKTVRAASPRPRIVYADNSFHGKTMGALSVTGREKHRQIFRPILPGCDGVPFGDLDALSAELEKGDVAAVILEPIQGEGGVIVPPEGYLQGVAAACRTHGAYLVLDEIQTGLGRTGRLFACEWDGVEPDILILAKSLSGGMVPIGATLFTETLWDTAYGSTDRFALHTSTFGGGNFACSAGLATLEVLCGEGLADNALRVGARLKEKLSEIVARTPFLKAVRGRGLMLALEFDSPYEGGINAFARDFASRFPGDFRETYRFLSDDAKDALRVLVEELEGNFEEMFVFRFVTKLSNDHNILTFVTANNSKVMRLQPPLVLTEEQVDYFAECFGKVCAEMATFLD